MNVLVACEESQEVCKAFRAKGHEAYSCDLQECSGGHPEWHINGDALAVLNGDCTFKTADGQTHQQAGEWDLIIAHPPCTYLSTAATQCHSLKCYTKEQIAERTKKRIEAMQFFYDFCKCKMRAHRYREPDRRNEYLFSKTRPNNRTVLLREIDRGRRKLCDKKDRALAKKPARTDL